MRSVVHRAALATLGIGSSGPLASTAGANVVIALCGLVSGTLLARLLGAEGRGELAAIQAWPIFLATAGSFGLGEAAAYFAAREPERARTTLASTTVLLMPFAIAAVVIGVWIVPRVLAAYTPGVRSAALASLSLVLLLALLAVPWQTLRGAGQTHAGNLLRVISPAGWALALGVLALTDNVRAADAALTFVGVIGVSAVVAQVYAWRALRGSAAPSSRLVRPLLEYGAPTAVTALPQWLNLRLDQLVMIALLAPESVGLYAVAIAWAGAVQPIATVLAFTAVPTLARADDRLRKARVVFRSGALVSTAASGLLLIGTPFLLPIVFGSEFRAAVPVALITVIAAAISGTSVVGGECLRGLGRPRALLAAECAGLVVTAVAVPLVIPLAGVLGAAAISLASYSVVVVVQWRFISTTTRDRPAETGLVLALDAPRR